MRNVNCCFCNASMKVGDYELNICSKCRQENEKLEKEAEKERLEKVIAYHGGYEKWSAIVKKQEEEKKKWEEEREKEREENRKKMLNKEMKIFEMRKAIIPIMEQLGFKRTFVASYETPAENEFSLNEDENVESIFLTAGDRLSLEITWKSFEKFGEEKLKLFIQEELPNIIFGKTKWKYAFILQKNESPTFRWKKEVVDFRHGGRMKEAVEAFLTLHKEHFLLTEDVSYFKNTNNWIGYNPEFKPASYGNMVCKNILDHKTITFYVYEYEIRVW